MEAMTRHRSHSAVFKRQVAAESIAGETLHALSKRHDISRQLIRIWVGKFEAGALDDDMQAADLVQEYEAKIAALERLVGRQALEHALDLGGPARWSGPSGVPSRPIPTRAAGGVNGGQKARKSGAGQKVGTKLAIASAAFRRSTING